MRYDSELVDSGKGDNCRRKEDLWAWARLQAGTGQNRAHYYSFRQQPPVPAGSVYDGWGASHFAELWYVFNHLNQETWNWTAADQRVSEEMSSYWINFARSGDPNGPGLPWWGGRAIRMAR